MCPLWNRNAPPLGFFWRRRWLESVSELQTDSSPRSSVRNWSSPGFTVSVVWRRLRAELGVEMSAWESRCGNENQRGSMSLTVKSLRCLWRGRRCLSSRAGAMNVFDRSMKRRQKQWTSSLPDSDKYDYLRDEVRRCITARLCLGAPKLCEWTSALLCLQVASRLADRVYDVSRSLPAYYIPLNILTWALKETVHTKISFRSLSCRSTLYDFILFCRVEKEISSRMSCLLFTTQ